MFGGGPARGRRGVPARRGPVVLVLSVGLLLGVLSPLHDPAAGATMPLAAPHAVSASPAFSTVRPARPEGIQDEQFWLDAVGVRAAWASNRGRGVRVAVLDSGIARGVPVLDDAVVGGTDMSGLGSPDGRTPIGRGDAAAHGTWVASLLAGRGTDAGLLGTAPEAEILSVSLGYAGSGASKPFSDQVAEGVRWAVDNGADVINLSFTTNEKGWPPSWDAAFLYAAEHDVVVVAAAGNRGSGTEVVGAPATIPGVLVVGGVTRAGRASGSSSTQGITIAVTAPSEELLGADPVHGAVRWEGTSGAAPIVAGVVALVRAAHPELDAANVIERVIRTATPAPEQAGVRPSPRYGYGLVDAEAAVSARVPRVTANPLGSLAEWVSVYRPSTSGGGSVPVDPNLGEAAELLRAERDAGRDPAGRESAAERLVIPFVWAAGTAILALLGVTAASRRFRRASVRE